MAQPELAANALMDDLMIECHRFYYQLGPFSTLSEFEKARIERDIRVKIDDLGKLSKGYGHAAMVYLQAALGDEKEMSKEQSKVLEYLDEQAAYTNYAGRLNMLGYPKKATHTLERYLELRAPSTKIILTLSFLYRSIGLFSEDVKLMKTYSKLTDPKINDHLPEAIAFQQYLNEHDITQDESEFYFTIVNNYFFSQRVKEYTFSRSIMEDDENETWISTEYHIQDDLSSDQIHSMNMGLLKLLAKSDISDKAFDHFVTSIY
ncbi:hypothetical protein [Marinomonas primoryensis]|uniref:Uncharacterized protein n=1 Tax=Marinomonas primoryensis TaxID=178399 RepID=A0ABV0L4X6_9GAMM